MSQFVRAKNLTVMVYVVSFTHSYSPILLGKQGGGDSLKWYVVVVDSRRSIAKNAYIG